MIQHLRTAALVVLLALACAVPAAAQQSSTILQGPKYDARLVPPPARAAEARVKAAALPRPVAGAGLLLLGAGLMYVTKQAEGEDGEEGVPFIPLLSGTMGAMTFWYGVYKLAVER